MGTFSMQSDTSIPKEMVHGKTVLIKFPVTLQPGLMLKSPRRSILLWRINTVSMIIKMQCDSICLIRASYKKTMWNVLGNQLRIMKKNVIM